jgi:transposase
MSLKPRPIQPVPDETARVARAAFPKGNVYLKLRDQLGTIFSDEDFAPLFPKDGQPTYSPWRLALVTVLQFREHLADRPAAEAVRARMDWKYLLGLELTDAGFDFSVLSEFRARLLAGQAEGLLLEKLLQECRACGFIKARGKQRTDSTHVLAAIRVMNRLELLGETVRAALNALATVAPDWLRAIAPPEWHARYDRRVEQGWLPKGKEKREVYAQTVGQDGFALLAALEAPETPQSLRQLPVIETLRLTWQRHYEQTREPSGQRQVKWKAEKDLSPAAEALESPYDADARFRTKRDTQWTGYMVHLTETCEPDTVNLLTHVVTTAATVHEMKCTADIHQALVDKQLPPGDHLVDAAYADAALLVSSQTDHAIRLVGPARPETRWQAKEPDAYTQDQFRIDWEQQRVQCPQGKYSAGWKAPSRDSRDQHIAVHFQTADCRPCPARSRCTRAKQARRKLGFWPQAQQEALQAARVRHTSEEGRRLYAKRAGIEGTLSQGVRAFELRRTRYWGQAKTRLQHIATAAAINIDRLMNWLDETLRAQTRLSRFKALAI